MGLKENDRMKKGFFLKPYVWAVIIAWTLIVAASLAWNINEEKMNILEAAQIQARIAFEKDITYRRWNAGHGGVYAPVTEETPPNPYLEGIVSERDIFTPSGKPLTLVNPAYMTRQVHELAEKKYGVKGHITSLKPIRPGNAADPWETESLKAFEQGETEISSVEKINGKEYMRLMRPLITEKGCLKCHSSQGYIEGDIRGGISISVPMEPLRAIGHRHIITLSLAHFLLWLTGLWGIVWGTNRIKQSDRDRRQAEEKIIKAAQEWRHTFDSIIDMVSVLDTDYKIVKANRALADFLGTTPEELIGKHCYKVIHGLNEPFPDCPYKEMMKVKKTVTREIFNTKYGLHMMVTVSPLFENGELKGSVHFMKDITESKKMAEALQEKEQLLKTIYETEPECVKVINPDGTIKVMNPAGLAMIEADSLEQVAGHNILIFIAEEYRDAFQQLSQDVLKGGSGTFEFEIVGLKGTRRWLETHAVPLRDTKNEITGLLGITRDITDRIKAEEELHKHREHLEELVKERTDDLEKTNKQLRAAVMELDSFSYSISHDLKAPLRAISGFSNILLEDHSGSLDKEAQQKLNVIHANAVQMGRLIDDILKYSRMGRQPLKKTEIDLKMLAQGVFNELKQEFPERTIHFNIATLPPCEADKVMIKQIMTNLLSNAIKFTKQREVAEIEIGSMQENDETVYYIRDNGVGFDMKYFDKLFELFQRLHSAKEYEGTGVGLAIVQRLVHRHGGRVWAEGKVDEGATFYFTLG